MKRPAHLLRLAAIVAALAVLLVWWWPERAGSPAAPTIAFPPDQTTPAPPPPATAASPERARRLPALSAAARALLATLERALAERAIRPGEAVLTFRDDAAFRRFLERAHSAGLAVLGRVDALRSVRVRFAEADAVAADLAAHPDDYAAAGANGLMLIPQPPPRDNRTPVDEIPFGDRALAYVGAEDNGTWGRGVTIAVLDTGVAGDETFGGRLRALDLGYGAAPGQGRSDGHGTGVAALAAGASADAGGVAPGASLLSIRVTDTNGLSDLFTVSQAIVAAVDAGAQVINVSLGGYAGGAMLDAALDYATARGAAVVAAAGNDQAAQLAWPAAEPRVVSVGAIDAAGQQVSFSNSGEQLRLTAPGYGVQTAWLEGQRAYVNGTSASAPLVAGAIAALMSQNPSLGATEAAQVLAATASEAGAPGADPAYGYGILNLAWAMNRNNTAYIDTAVASHAYDTQTGQMQFPIQNRSGRAVSGLTLTVTAGATTRSYPVPSLAPGESYVARTPVDSALLRQAGSITFTTELSNPAGVVDRVPANNRRSSVLTPPPRP